MQHTERTKQIDPGIQFLTSPREYVLLNSTDDNVEIQWDGETRTVPKIDKVAQETEYWGPGKDATGKLIPGSLAIRDIFEFDTTFGNEVMLWSAANCIKNVLGIDVKTGYAQGGYAKRGLSLLPKDPSAETVAKVRAAGRERWAEWRLVDARNIINSHDEKNMTRQRLGLGTVPPPPEYNKALHFLNAYDQKEREEAAAAVQTVSFDDLVPPVEVSSYGSAMEGLPVPDSTEAPPTNSGDAQQAPSQSTSAYEALADQLLQDPEFQKVLRARAIMAGGKRKK